MKEDKIPYLVENKERDTFTIYVKGTKPYLDLQQRINKAKQFILEHSVKNNREEIFVNMKQKELLEILDGDKENE